MTCFLQGCLSRTDQNRTAFFRISYGILKLSEFKSGNLDGLGMMRLIIFKNTARPSDLDPHTFAPPFPPSAGGSSQSGNPEVRAQARRLPTYTYIHTYIHTHYMLEASRYQGHIQDGAQVELQARTAVRTKIVKGEVRSRPGSCFYMLHAGRFGIVPACLRGCVGMRWTGTGTGDVTMVGLGGAGLGCVLRHEVSE